MIFGVKGKAFFSVNIVRNFEMENLAPAYCAQYEEIR